jgi:predicted nucleotidyltransferase
MKLTPNEQHVINHLVRRLKEDFHAERVMLYGSAARGDMDAESDIDLLIFLPAVTWEVEKRIGRKAFEAGLEIDRIISTACFSPCDIDHGPMRVSPFIVNVLREGRSL